MADGTTKRILVVEDEQHLAAGLKLNFELEGYAVEVASTAREAGQRLLQPESYDAIVLDVMLPDIDGFELCRRLRESGNFTPVVMLTARAAAEDRVRGLEVGADDYLVKPFDLNELLARVRSVLRRRRWERDANGSGRDRVLVFGDARIDFDAHEATMGGEAVRLTQLEFDLLAYFASNPGRVLRRQELLENVWKLQSWSTARTIDNFMSRLRRAFEPDPVHPVHFISVRGAGYKFVPVPERDEP